jgi:hypothetical protein
VRHMERILRLVGCWKTRTWIQIPPSSSVPGLLLDATPYHTDSSDTRCANQMLSRHSHQESGCANHRHLVQAGRTLSHFLFLDLHPTHAFAANSLPGGVLDIVAKSALVVRGYRIRRRMHMRKVEQPLYQYCRKHAERETLYYTSQTGTWTSAHQFPSAHGYA